MGRLVKGEKIRMKIVFDSEEQLNKHRELLCPCDVAQHVFFTRLSHDPEDCAANNCEECWKKSGIVLEVEK